jgi:Fur family ferric uptake transcriptional regulator
MGVVTAGGASTLARPAQSFRIILDWVHWRCFARREHRLRPATNGRGFMGPRPGVMSQSFALEKVEVSLSPQERFEEFLQSRGKRNTPQRRVIVDQVFSRHEHFDVETLQAQLRAADLGGKASRPTVYRTLTEMVDAGLLRKMWLAGREVYEHDYGYPQHDHLYCQRCEKLIEFSSDEVKHIREAVAREHQFRPLGHRLIIYGLCSECSRPKRVKRPLDLV